MRFGHRLVLLDPGIYGFPDDLTHRPIFFFGQLSKPSELRLRKQDLQLLHGYIISMDDLSVKGDTAVLSLFQMAVEPFEGPGLHGAVELMRPGIGCPFEGLGRSGLGIHLLEFLKGTRDLTLIEQGILCT